MRSPSPRSWLRTRKRCTGSPRRCRRTTSPSGASYTKAGWLFEEDGRLIGAGFFGTQGDVGFIWGAVLERGRGIGTEIVERGEAAALAADVAKLHGAAQEPDAAGRALYESRGYREVRRFYEMAIELVDDPPAPVVPEGLVIDEVRDGEERAFHDALVEAFQDHWEFHALPYEEWYERRKGQHRDDEGPLWFVVRDGEEIAAVTRNETNISGGGYVGAIGVRRPWRGRGLAKALMYTTFAEFRRRGVNRVSLGVDADSPTGATHLYERVGMFVERCGVVFEKT
jgi:mycothiol synthase